MRATVSPRVRVKAAGGVRTLDALLEVMSIGVDRCGATRTAEMLDDFQARVAGLKSPAAALSRAPRRLLTDRLRGSSAAPIAPASGPSSAPTTSTSLGTSSVPAAGSPVGSGRAPGPPRPRSRHRSRWSGSRTAMTFASPMPMQPADLLDRGQCTLVTRRRRCVDLLRGREPSQSRERRAWASGSTQPRLPQPHRGPSGITTWWAISPARPFAPVWRRPSIVTPPPIRSRASRRPRSGNPARRRSRPSASVNARASLMSVTEARSPWPADNEREARPRPGQVREQLDRPPVTVEQARHPHSDRRHRPMSLARRVRGLDHPPRNHLRPALGRRGDDVARDRLGVSPAGSMTVDLMLVPPRSSPTTRGDHLPGNVRFATAWLLMSALP